MDILLTNREEPAALSSPSSLTVVVAVNRSKNSFCAIKWTLEKFLSEERICFKLLHVCPPITTVPTPLGNYLISQVRDDVAVAYKKEMEWKTLKMLLPYKQMFTAKKVEVEVLLIEADDVADAIARQ
ncbi:U-box domain-containing protein 35-like, partial [Thalictrum thalictroides]